MTLDFTIRRLSTREDYGQCVALQHEIWGEQSDECVPPAILKVSQEVGGIAAGAFDEAGRIIGCVYGMAGWRDSRLCHWSHMLGVKPELRDRGVGRRLKEYQRELLRADGVTEMYWTFDPLVARNAHLNLNKLGTSVVEYVPDMYVVDTKGDVDTVIGTDRFTVVWHLGEGVPQEADTIDGGETSDEAAVVDVLSLAGSSRGADSLPTDPIVRVEIPPDIHSLKLTNPEIAATWRAGTRSAFVGYFNSAYRVRGFFRDPESGRCFYVLKSDSGSITAG